MNNPLALVVLACLAEHPMHPYEMATTMRERGKDQSIKLNYGSLYMVVLALQQHGLIVAQETERAGRRPERTVYRLTDAGRPPEDAAALLAQRCNRLEMDISQGRSLLQLAAQRGVPRLNLIEGEYLLAMHEAELAWTRQFAEAIRSGTLEGIAEWVTYSDHSSE